MSFSETLKRMMGEREIKAAELSRLSGLSEAIISEYLSGRKEPRGKQSIAIAKVLSVSLDDLWETSFATENKKPAPKQEPVDLDESILLANFRSLPSEDRAELLRLSAHFRAKVDEQFRTLQEAAAEAERQYQERKRSQKARPDDMKA